MLYPMHKNGSTSSISNIGIEEQFQKEMKRKLVADIVVESVIDNLVDNNAADIEAKR